MQDDLRANLASAQSAIEAAEVVKPSSEELKAISAFCKSEIKRRQTEEKICDDIRVLRVQQKLLKAQLTKDIVKLCNSESGLPKCVALTKEDSKRYEELAKAENLEPMDPFARIVQVNKDASITPEVIQEALENVSSEDLQEAAAAASEDGTVTTRTTVRQLVLTNIRRIIRSFVETLKMSDSLPRGSTVYDVADAPSDVAARMWKLWSLDQNIKKNLSKKKDTTATQTPSEEGLKTKIESFFIRTGLTAQRIVIEGHAYRLVRRISVRKPKIGVGRFEQILDTSLDEALIDKINNFKPIDFMKALQIQLSSVPAESKSNVVLCKIAED